MRSSVAEEWKSCVSNMADSNHGRLMSTLLQSSNNNGKGSTFYMLVGIQIGSLTTLAAILCVYYFFLGLAGPANSNQLLPGTWHKNITVDGVVIEQNIRVTDDSVILKIPNQLEVVFDFRHQLTAEHVYNADTGRCGPCFARPLDRGNRMSREDNLDKKRTANPGNHNLGNRDSSLLVTSTDISEICRNADVLWVKDGHTRRLTKRRTDNCVEVDRKCIRIGGGPCMKCAIVKRCPDIRQFKKTICEDQ